MVSIFNQLFNTSLNKNIKEMYIYCIGSVGKMCYRYFENSQIKILGFIVTEKRGQEVYDNVPIYEIKSLGCINAPILVATLKMEYIKEITDILLKLKYEDFYIMKKPMNFHYKEKLSMEFIEKFDIYNLLQDDLSKKIFFMRVAFSMGLGFSYIRQIIADKSIVDDYEDREYINILQLLQ